MLKLVNFCWIALLLLLLSMSTVQAESIYLLQQETASLAEEAQQAYAQLHTLEQINQIGQRRVESAAMLINSARSSNEHNYYQIAYVGERAAHIRAYAVYLITLLKNQKSYVEHAQQVEQHISGFRVDDQLKGLRALLAMVLMFQEEGLLNVGSEDKPSMVQQQVEIYILGNLLAIQKSNNADFIKATAQIKLSVYQGLSGLKDELIYLDHQLDTIHTQEG